MKHRMVHSRHRNKCANLRGFLGCLTAQTHLISWMREILRGDMAGLVSDFRLSESRRIPRFKGKRFLVSRNPSKDSTINIRRWINTNLHSCTIGDCEGTVVYFHSKLQENLICYTDGSTDQHTLSTNPLQSLDSPEIPMTSNGLSHTVIRYYFLKTALFSGCAITLSGTTDTREQC